MANMAVFEALNATLANIIRGVVGTAGLSVHERKGPIRLDKDTLPGVYVSPVAERPVGYCFNNVVIVEYSNDVVIVAQGDQQLEPPDMSLAPSRVETIRLALDIPQLPGMPTINESRWEMVTNLYDRGALSNNYDRTAIRFYYKSDEVRNG